MYAIELSQMKIGTRKENTIIGMSVNKTHLFYSLVGHHKNEQVLLNQGSVKIEETEKLLDHIKSSFDFPCYLAVPHSFMMSKILHFTEEFKEAEILNLLTFNAEQYFSCPREEICFDFEFINHTKKDIRVIAGKKEYIANWKKLFLSKKLKLKVISIDFIAVERLLLNLKLNDNQVYAIFLWQNFELVQIIFAEGRALFYQNCLIPEGNMQSLAQEITQFLRLYEMKKIKVNVVSQIVLLGFDEEMIEKFQNQYALNILDTSKFKKKFFIGASCLLSIGMVIKC